MSVDMNNQIYDEYAHAERIAICLDSGVPYELAKRIADNEQPKPELEAVKRLQTLRAKMAQEKFDKSRKCKID